jgi:carboxyl-terminal processing protease
LAGIRLRAIILLLIGILIGIFISEDNVSGRRLGFSPARSDDKISKVLELGEPELRRFGGYRQHCRCTTVNDMLQSLDPHSVYLPAQQARSISERLECRLHMASG